MKRTILVEMLLLGGVLAAQADNDVYKNTMRHPRSDAELQADTQDCSQRLGAPQSGSPTSRQYKRCMLAHGWRFDHKERENTWIDPETGLRCKDFTFLGIVGSNCSNF